MSERDIALLEALTAEVAGLQVACAQLARDNAELRERLGALANPRESPPRTVAPSSGRVISRRGVLTKGLGAAAATVVGGAALANRDALPALASNGSTLTAGAVTNAEARTSVLYDGAASFPGVVLLGNDSTYGGQSANYPRA